MRVTVERAQLDGPRWRLDAFGLGGRDTAARLTEQWTGQLEATAKKYKPQRRQSLRAPHRVRRCRNRPPLRQYARHHVPLNTSFRKEPQRQAESTDGCKFGAAEPKIYEGHRANGVSI